MTPEELESLKIYRDILEHVDLEIACREVTGKPNKYPKMTDEQLASDRRWYSDKIDAILAPYEREDNA